MEARGVVQKTSHRNMKLCILELKSRSDDDGNHAITECFKPAFAHQFAPCYCRVADIIVSSRFMHLVLSILRWRRRWKEA